MKERTKDNLLWAIASFSAMIMALTFTCGVMAAEAGENHIYSAAIFSPNGTDAVVAIRNLGPDAREYTMEIWSASVRNLPVCARTRLLQPGETRWHYFNRSEIEKPGEWEGMSDRFKKDDLSLHIVARGGELLIDGFYYSIPLKMSATMNIRETAPYSIPLR